MPEPEVPYPMPDKDYHRIIVLLLVGVLALVEVMTWLGLIRKFGQVNIPTPLTTPIPTMFGPPMSTTLRLMLWSSLWPILRTTLRTFMIPEKYLTQTPLLQLTAEDMKYGTNLRVVCWCLKIGT